MLAVEFVLRDPTMLLKFFVFKTEVPFILVITSLILIFEEFLCDNDIFSTRTPPKIFNDFLIVSSISFTVIPDTVVKSIFDSCILAIVLSSGNSSMVINFDMILLSLINSILITELTSVVPTNNGRSFELLISSLANFKMTSPCLMSAFAAGLSSSILATRAPLGLSSPKLSASSLSTC